MFRFAFQNYIMAQEIERKFLVKNKSFIELSSHHESFKQAYLNSNPERCVRIRITDSKSFITIKGKSTDQGLSRFEWEKEIPTDEAEQLMLLCEDFSIEKKRYDVKNGKHTIEVDVFEGSNEGLIVAEIELSSADETYEKPDWLGEEVTGKKPYYNAALSNLPFSQWS